VKRLGVVFGFGGALRGKTEKPLNGGRSFMKQA
jgi:hypothetical protein